MTTMGVVLRKADAALEQRARAAGCEVVEQEGWDIPWPRTLFVRRGMRLDKELIEAGMRWLKSWDAAAPLLGALATNVGDVQEREKTLALVHDLRVPVYSPEILFVAQNEVGEAFLQAYVEEGEGPQGLLRALYRTKPRFLALPRQWILRDGRVEPGIQLTRPRALSPASRNGQKMIQVEVSPGRFVKCWPGEEEKMIARYGKRGRHANQL